MTREVVLTETAQQQMNAATDWYAEQNPTVAAKWFNGLIHRLNMLAENPDQYSVARESEFLPVELRQMLYGSGKRITHYQFFQHVNTSTEYTKPTSFKAGGHTSWAH